MAYQWIHIEAVSKAGRDIYSTINGKKVKVGQISVASVLGEAGRLEGYISHVENPLSPVIIFGDKEKGIEDVRQKFEDWLSGTKDARGHKMRIDANGVLSGVVSWPPINDDENEKEYKEKIKTFENELINYLKDEYGEDLILVLRHDDEPFKGLNAGKIHYHWHFFCVKKPGEKFDLHPGFLARSEYNVSRENRKSMKHEELKTNYKDGCEKYKEAMIQFQDEFHQELGRHFNLIRFGPRRLRRSRYEEVEVENYVEKELEYSKKIMDEALKLKEEADKKLIEAENIKIAAKEEADVIIMEAKYIADEEKAEADEIIKEAKSIKDNAWGEAKDITKAAKKKAEKIKQDADHIANEKKASADELLSTAKKEAAEIIKEANSIKNKAWVEASVITNAANEEAERILIKEKDKADKLLSDAKKYATKIINKAESFINDLLAKISKLSGGDIVVKWAKNTIKSITKPNKESKTNTGGKKKSKSPNH
jgi:hypothetical protein